MLMMGDKKKTLIAIMGPREEEKKDEGGGDALLECAKELLACIKEDDPEGALSALRTIFAELDSEPHSEGEHTDGEY